MTAFPGTLFAGQRFAVFGLGRNGAPVARALQAMGAAVVAWDDSAPARAEAADLALGDLMAGDFAFDALILSPGVPHRLPKPHPVAARAQAAGVPILSDAELLFQAVRRAGSRARFAGITGTNGKSTTTALLAHILQGAGVPVAAGGNLGTAALDLPLLPDNGVYVLEMSSYMLERLATLRFNVAAMLNLSPDHLDRHGDMEGYAAAKHAIFDRQTGEDTAVLGATVAIPKRLAARVVIARPEPVAAPALPGAHNAENAAAARAMARALGVAGGTIEAAIARFPGLAHRQSLVATADGVAWINDSKATNADAAARALSCYDRIIWIAGGIAKAGGIDALAPYFPRIAEALLIGRDAPTFAATLRAAGVPYRIVETLDTAVRAAARVAKPGDTVLLSPAAASFDQFSGFEARGDRFAALVTQLPPRKEAR
jgi:UDP-N-acetylmuramoylalanine--D-glutamate ligase